MNNGKPKYGDQCRQDRDDIEPFAHLSFPPSQVRAYNSNRHKYAIRFSIEIGLRVQQGVFRQFAAKNRALPRIQLPVQTQSPLHIDTEDHRTFRKRVFAVEQIKQFHLL
jgi:hypothetical protein